MRRYIAGLWTLMVACALTPCASAQVPADTAGAAPATDTAAGRFPDAAEAVVRAGSFPGSIEVPGTGLALRVGGLVQVLALETVSGQMATPDLFLARAITADGGPAQALVTARESRLSVDARGASGVGDLPFRAFVEVGFVGTGEQAAINADALALRHAFGQVGDLYAGQYWSALVDLRAFPETIDRASPAGKTVTRQAGVRYNPWVRGVPGDGTRLAIGVENPETDAFLLGPDGARATGALVDGVPDMVGDIRVERPGGHVQLAAVLRRFGADGAGGAWGGGAALSGSLALPALSPQSRATASLSGGPGYGRYLVELAGGGYDAVLDPDARALGPLVAVGGYASLQHWWSSTLRSTVAAGAVRVEANPGLPPRSVRTLSTALVNVFWSPGPRVALAFEVVTGRRSALDGTSARATRLHGLARYAF